MAYKTKKVQVLSVGAPITKPYKPEYCEMLVEHMRGGNTYTSFGAVIDCGKDQLYKWEHNHVEFAEAKARGFVLAQYFWENLAKSQAAGQLRRLKSETPVLDKEGRPLLDPGTGQVLMHREYEGTPGGQSTLLFMMKNMFPHDYRDRKELEFSAAGTPREESSLTPQEKLKEIKQVDRILLELDGDQIDSIEVSN